MQVLLAASGKRLNFCVTATDGLNKECRMLGSKLHCIYVWSAGGLRSR